MRLQKAVHLVPRLDAEEAAGLECRELSRPYTFGSQGDTSEALGVRCKVSGEFLRDFKMNVHRHLQSALSLDIARD
jgi:hypothetical protein